MGSIIRSIDIGFGNTKYVRQRGPNGQIDCGLFPSVAPLAISDDLADGVLQRRNTVIVCVDGVRYEVGADAALARSVHATRVLHKNFVRTCEYRALFLGALAFMDQPRIDLLVVGLPVADLPIHSDELRAKLVGRHEVSEGRSVEIGRVLVLAQPLGGFVEFALGHGVYQDVRETMNLVIDPGFFTLDWVVARGIRPVVARCGSFAGGMHAVLGRLAKALGRDHGVAVDDELLLDEGLRTGSFNLYGAPVELANYEGEVRPIIDQALGALTNAVGDGKDIRNIVLVGGAAALYRSGVQRCFPRHRVHTVPDAVFANVRGFQRAGEQLLESGGVR